MLLNALYLIIVVWGENHTNWAMQRIYGFIQADLRCSALSDTFPHLFNFNLASFTSKHYKKDLDYKVQ